MNSNKFVDYLSYEVDDEPSDVDSDEISSSDEIEKDYESYLNAKRTKSKTKEAKLADEFEDEMNQQLDTLVSKQQEKYLTNETQGEAASSTTNKILYEEEEDTDSDEELRTGERCTKKKQKFTNDELFYDPDMDEEDQNWINKQRQTSKKVLSPKKKVKKESDSNEPGTSSEPQVAYIGANSDAVLNCPCCMTNVCYDCQRHEKFRTQYRAMFVFNCKINEEDTLKYPKNQLAEKKFNRKKSKLNKVIQSVADIEISGLADEESNNFDFYRPVNCSNCNTEIGVYEEKEEIYHFFNVLASHS